MLFPINCVYLNVKLLHIFILCVWVLNMLNMAPILRKECSFQESVFSSSHVGPRDQTWVPFRFAANTFAH